MNKIFKCTLYAVLMLVPNFLISAELQIDNSSRYVIEGSWLFRPGRVFREGIDLQQFRNSKMDESIRRVFDRIGSYKCFSDPGYEFGSEVELIDSLNAFIRNFSYEENAESINSILGLVKERSTGGDDIVSTANTAIRLADKEPKSDSDRKRLNRYLLEIIYPGQFVESGETARGKWEWTINLEGELNNVEKVKYDLPARAGENEQNEIASSDETVKEGFRQTISSYGGLDVPIQIRLKDGTEIDTTFKPRIKKYIGPLEDRIKFTNTAEYNEKDKLWDWAIFLDSDDPAVIDSIDFVEYRLHSTFPDPIKIMENPEDRFRLEATGWGTFEIKIKVVLKNGRIIDTKHALKF